MEEVGGGGEKVSGGRGRIYLVGGVAGGVGGVKVVARGFQDETSRGGEGKVLTPCEGRRAGVCVGGLGGGRGHRQRDEGRK